MISLPFRVACILIAGFLIVLAVTYIYKLNSRKVFWGVGLTAIIGILILLGLGVLRPSWGTETGTAVIVGISTAIGCAITLIYAAEDLHQKKRIKGKKITETESVQEDMVPDRHKVTLPSRLCSTSRFTSDCHYFDNLILNWQERSLIKPLKKNISLSTMTIMNGL